eukprot:13275364-Ditylum_brightwellii.AAC.1
MLVAGSTKGANSSVVDAALDLPSSTLPMSVAGSTKGVNSSVVDAALDPPSLVDLPVCAANFSVH